MKEVRNLNQARIDNFNQPSLVKAVTAFITLIFLLTSFLMAQEPVMIAEPDTLLAPQDTISWQTEDKLQDIDLENITPESRFALEAKVEYKSADSIYFDLINNKAFLYMNAEIKYMAINLKAHYIEIDFNTNTLFAKGLPDSLGNITGTPVFSEGDQSFMAQEMRYNFTTSRGLIKQVITQEGEGFIHGEVVKKMEDDITHVGFGSYTTCNLDCPHFEFRYNKAKIIPGEKIITGPVFLVIEDVPLPLAIPFGFFPNKKKQASGILIPTWGESASRGFYFENGGYYFGLNDYTELYLEGDIYTRGSWAVKPRFNYRKRYKHQGTVNLNYANNVTGERGTPSYNKYQDFAIRWSHNQDPKAHPTQRLSANVNIQSQFYNRFNPVSSQNLLSNTFQSSVTYQRSFGGKYFLNVGATHNQNTSTGQVTFTLPDVSFNVNRFYPLRRKTRVGALRWYEDISMNYTLNSRNQVTTLDSLLFRPETLNQFRNGVRHSIPITSNIKVLRHVNFSNSFNYTERWYTQRIEQQWVEDSSLQSGGRIQFDTLSGFYGVRDFSYTTSLNTTLFGMLLFKKGKLMAVRHVVNPSIGLTLRPDFGSEFWNYWGDVQIDTTGRTRRYSYFQNGIFGTPPDGRSGFINLGLNNNLEIKVRSKRDTITGERKIKLIEQFGINGGYDLALDSLQWSRISLSGRTTLFKYLSIIYNASFDPYAVDSLGRRINKFVWNTDQKLLRRENTSWNFSVRYSVNSSNFGGRTRTTTADNGNDFMDNDEFSEAAEIYMYPDEFIDWNQNWSLNVDYSLVLTNRFIHQRGEFDKTTVQSVNFFGDVNLTPKWKIGFRSGFDLVSKQFTFTSLNFYRDLHCWEMRFNWIPMGVQKSWNFQINVKSSILQDLKMTRRKDFRDF